MAYDNDMSRFNVHDAKTHFSKLLQRVELGEEIEIARNGEVVAKLVRAPSADERAALRRQAFGMFKDEIVLREGWDEPLTEEELFPNPDKFAEFERRSTEKDPEGSGS